MRGLAGLTWDLRGFEGIFGEGEAEGVLRVLGRRSLPAAELSAGGGSEGELRERGRKLGGLTEAEGGEWRFPATAVAEKEKEKEVGLVA